MGLTVEVAFDVAPGDEPTSGDWTDVTSRVAGPVTATRGAVAGGQAHNEATFQLDNLDGQMSPDVVGPALVRHCRIRVDSLPLFRGLTARWRPIWATNQARIDVRLHDALAWLALQDADVDLPAQRSHDRIDALLDLAGWPESLRDVGDGVVRLSAWEQNGANLRRLVEDSADAEDGDLHVDRDGTLRFRSRHHRFDASPQIQLAGDGAASGVRVANGLTPTYDTDHLITVARVERADGDVFESTDPAAVGDFGPRTVSVRDLPMPDAEATAAANWLVYRFSEPTTQFRGVPVYADDDRAAVLAVQLGDLVEFTHVPPGGTVQPWQGHVERQVDRFETGRFVSTWDLSPYFGEGPWGRWESSEATSGSEWVSETATEGPRWAP